MFHGLTAKVDLLPLLLIENLGIVGQLFRDWEFEIEAVGREICGRKSFSVFFKKVLASKP